jgi:hypothetical protein
MKNGELVYRLYRISRKLMGMGLLLSSENIGDMSIDEDEAREGIGQIVSDLAEDLRALAEEMELNKLK